MPSESLTHLNMAWSFCSFSLVRDFKMLSIWWAATEFAQRGSPVCREAGKTYLFGVVYYGVGVTVVA